MMAIKKTLKEWNRYKGALSSTSPTALTMLPRPLIRRPVDEILDL